MIPNRRFSRPPRIAMLVGWLFADLFLMLFVVSLASLPLLPHHATRHRPTPSPTPTVRQPRVLDQNPVSFPVSVPPAEVQQASTKSQALALILRDLNRKIASKGYQHRRAGFVLVFASGPLDGVGLAQSTARMVLKVIKARDPVFSQSSGVGYWMGSGDEFDFKVFFFVGQGST